MFDRHFQVWPKRLPRSLSVPETTLPYNLEVTARRYPRNRAIVYYGKALTYADLATEVERLAGFLQRRLGVARGDRVLLCMQNSPQFVIAYYAILRADAVVVPVNPMNRAGEMEHLVADTGAKTALFGQELLPVMQVVLAQGRLPNAVVAAYSDYADENFDLPIPDAVRAPARSAADIAAMGIANVFVWRDALAAHERPGPALATPDDYAVFPYSSGTTGHPKGCMHTHRTVMTTLVGGEEWNPMPADATHLVTLPLFHVTGMQSSMNMPIYTGGAMVMMTRWDRRVAASLIQREKISRWRNITTMVIDLVNDPDVAKYDLSSLVGIGGGGAAMPEVVSERLHAMTGLDYVEGYGMSETMAATHINPIERPKRQCLGIPVFDVDSRVVSVETGEELPPGEVGEIVIAAPQLFKGYWNDPQGTAAALFERDGKTFLRTGDLGYYDEEGYFFLVDRVKRMINASGFKVWPAEVEAMMLRHPAIAQVCIVAAPDPRRGETVKACVVPREGVAADEAGIIAWCHANMAAYKCPTLVEIRGSLPQSATGKVQWRELQQQQRDAAT